MKDEILVLVGADGVEGSPSFRCLIFPSDALDKATTVARGLAALHDGVSASHPICVAGRGC